MFYTRLLVKQNIFCIVQKTKNWNLDVPDSDTWNTHIWPFLFITLFEVIYLSSSPSSPIFEVIFHLINLNVQIKWQNNCPVDTIPLSWLSHNNKSWIFFRWFAIKATWMITENSSSFSNPLLFSSRGIKLLTTNPKSDSNLKSKPESNPSYKSPVNPKNITLQLKLVPAKQPITTHQLDRCTIFKQSEHALLVSKALMKIFTFTNTRINNYNPHKYL